MSHVIYTCKGNDIWKRRKNKNDFSIVKYNNALPTASTETINDYMLVAQGCIRIYIHVQWFNMESLNLYLFLLKRVNTSRRTVWELLFQTGIILRNLLQLATSNLRSIMSDNHEAMCKGMSLYMYQPQDQHTLYNHQFTMQYFQNRNINNFPIKVSYNFQYKYKRI